MMRRGARASSSPGHRGMVGQAIVRALQARGHEALILATRDELDLTDAGAVDALVRDTDARSTSSSRRQRSVGILANSTSRWTSST